MLAEVESGAATMSVGRRRPLEPGAWPWHARVGNQVVLAWLRRRTGLPAARHLADAGVRA